MYSVADTLAGGFPHSDIFGSQNAPVSPKLFAGCHVLHRLSSPRHPPGALIALKNPHTQAPRTITALEITSCFLVRPPLPLQKSQRRPVKILFPQSTSS